MSKANDAWDVKTLVELQMDTEDQYCAAAIGDYVAVVGASTWKKEVYVYSKTKLGWGKAAVATISGGDDDYFGYSLSVSADTIIVGTNDAYHRGARIFRLQCPSGHQYDISEGKCISGSSLNGLAIGVIVYGVLASLATVVVMWAAIVAARQEVRTRPVSFLSLFSEGVAEVCRSFNCAAEEAAAGG